MSHTITVEAWIYGPLSASQKGQPPGSPAWQHTLTLWKIRVDGLKPQQAMLQVADNITSSGFYITADDWTRQDGKEWGIGKRYGAFHSENEFVTTFLNLPPKPWEEGAAVRLRRGGSTMLQ